jgi:hypothetical protein
MPHRNGAPAHPGARITSRSPAFAAASPPPAAPPLAARCLVRSVSTCLRHVVSRGAKPGGPERSRQPVEVRWPSTCTSATQRLEAGMAPTHGRSSLQQQAFCLCLVMYLSPVPFPHVHARVTAPTLTIGDRRGPRMVCHTRLSQLEGPMSAHRPDQDTNSCLSTKFRRAPTYCTSGPARSSGRTHTAKVVHFFCDAGAPAQERHGRREEHGTQLPASPSLVSLPCLHVGPAMRELVVKPGQVRGSRSSGRQEVSQPRGAEFLWRI